MPAPTAAGDSAPPPSSSVPSAPQARRPSATPSLAPSSQSDGGRSISPTPTLVGEPGPSSPTKSASSSSLKLPTSFLHSASSSPSASPTGAAFPATTSAAQSRTSSRSSHQSQTSARSLDSVWDLDFETHWEWRQREDARRLAELKGATPYLSLGSYPNEHLERLRGGGKKGARRRGGASSGHGDSAQMGASTSSLGRAEEGGEDGDELYEEVKPRHPALEWLDNNRRQVRKIMRMKRLHLIIIGLVAFDLIIVIVELIVALLTAGCMSEEVYEYVVHNVEESNGHLSAASFACTMAPSHGREALEEAIFGINLALLSVFMTEVLAAIYAFGPITYVTSWVTLLDGFVVVTTLCLDVYFHLSKDPAAKSPIAVVILRLWKIFRAIHAIGHALSLHYNEMMEQAAEGRKKLELERMTESIRLNYVRNALIRATGHDIDPVLIEDEVQRERAAIELRRKAEEDRVYQELRKGSMFRARSRHGGVNNFKALNKKLKNKAREQAEA
ncbi:hypothetical protein JCM10213_004436 [Rhodosporidiobolus nylandii]